MVLGTLNLRTLGIVQMQDYLQSPLYAATSRPFKWIERNEHDTAAAMAEKRALRLDAEEDVSRAQRELDRHRREQQALNVRAQSIQADLEAFSAKTMKLVGYYSLLLLFVGTALTLRYSMRSSKQSSSSAG
jgi:hypothetical protein